MAAEPRPKHRGNAPAARTGEPERLALPLFIRKELGRLKAAGLWAGEIDDPALDPAVTLSMLMVDNRLDEALRAVCAKTLLPYFHDDRALMLKAVQGPDVGQVMVVVKQFGGPGVSARKAITNDRNEPPALERGTPDPPTPARIDATNAPGAALYTMATDPTHGIEKPRQTELLSKGFYEMRRGADGVERMVQVDHAPRIFNGTPPRSEGR